MSYQATMPMLILLIAAHCIIWAYANRRMYLAKMARLRGDADRKLEAAYKAAATLPIRLDSRLLN